MSNSGLLISETSAQLSDQEIEVLERFIALSAAETSILRDDLHDLVQDPLLRLMKSRARIH